MSSFVMNFDLKVDTSGFAGTKAQLDMAILKAATIIAMYCADDCADELENSPRRVDTGRLKNSIHGEVENNDTAVVSTNVEYAIYVHEGTRKMAANRFIRNGITNNMDEYKEIVEKCLKGA